MSYRGWLLAEHSLRLPDAEDGPLLEISARLYAREAPRAGAPARGPFLYLESDPECVEATEAGSLEELLRLVLAAGIREGVERRYFARSLFEAGGLAIDEARLGTFEDGLRAVAQEGDARRARADARRSR